MRPSSSDTFSDSILDLARNSEGVLAGVPYSVSNPVLFYNADLLREAGLSEDGPKSWVSSSPLPRR